jgi:hypothetical protein
MARGRKAVPCPDPEKLRELAAAGATFGAMKKQLGTSSSVAIARWFKEHGVARVIPDLLGEEWRPVVGWEGYYVVSNQGRVKSLPRITPGGTHIMGKLRQPAMQGRGNPYWQIHLMRGGKENGMYRVAVHRLVMESFVGPCPEGMEVCHINGNGFDNRLENLRYDTHANNMAEQALYEKLPICPCCGQQYDGKPNLKPRNSASYTGD